MAEKIAHEGIVTRIEHDSVTVTIQSTSACGSCHAKNMCHMSEKTDKEVVIKTKDAMSYTLGERVEVYLTSGMGMKAVLYAYVFSLIAAAAGFAIAACFTDNQGIWGLCALGTLLVYFFFLRLCSGKINAKFHFGIAKKNGMPEMPEQNEP